MKKAKVSIIMGSKSDWSTMKHCADMLEKLAINHEVKIVSAHRTPDLLFSYAENAISNDIQVIIAGAGGVCSFTWNGCLKNTSTCYWCTN